MRAQIFLESPCSGKILLAPALDFGCCEMYVASCTCAKCDAPRAMERRSSIGRSANRTARSGPRQRVVSHLGEIDSAGRLGVLDAAQGHDGVQSALFTESDAEWVEVDVRRVRTERSRRFGDA